MASTIKNDEFGAMVSDILNRIAKSEVGNLSADKVEKLKKTMEVVQPLGKAMVDFVGAFTAISTSKNLFTAQKISESVVKFYTPMFEGFNKLFDTDIQMAGASIKIGKWIETFNQSLVGLAEVGKTFSDMGKILDRIGSIVEVELGDIPDFKLIGDIVINIITGIEGIIQRLGVHFKKLSKAGVTPVSWRNKIESYLDPVFDIFDLFQNMNRTMQLDMLRFKTFEASITKALNAMVNIIENFVDQNIDTLKRLAKRIKPRSNSRDDATLVIERVISPVISMLKRIEDFDLIKTTLGLVKIKIFIKYFGEWTNKLIEDLGKSSGGKSANRFRGNLDFLDSLRNFLGGLWFMIPMMTVLSGVMKVWPGITNGLKKFMENLGEALAVWKEVDISKTDIAKLVVLGPALGALAASLTVATTVFNPLVMGLFKAGMKLFAEAMEPLKEGMKAFSEAMIEGSLGILIAVGSIMAIAASILAVGLGIGLVLQTIGQLVELILNNVGKVMQLMTKWGETLLTIFKGIGNIFKTIGTAILDVVTGIFTGVVNVMNTFGTVFKTIGTAILDVVTGIFTGVVNIMNTFGTVFTTIVDTLSKSIGLIMETFATTLERLAKPAIGFGLLLTAAGMTALSLATVGFIAATTAMAATLFLTGNPWQPIIDLANSADGLERVVKSLQSINAITSGTNGVNVTNQSQTIPTDQTQLPLNTGSGQMVQNYYNHAPIYNNTNQNMVGSSGGLNISPDQLAQMITTMV